MHGLWITHGTAEEEAALRAVLQAQLIPFEGFTHEPAFDPPQDRDSFLRSAAEAVMLGRPLPMGGVLRHLQGRDALPGNVLRRYVCLRLSLLPTLRADHGIVPLEGGWLLGHSLAVLPLGEDGRIDALLPPGIWTELSTGEELQGRVRRIRGLNAMPVLARENSVVGIGVDDRSARGDDEDRITLHWFRPAGESGLTLAGGVRYRLAMQNGRCTCDTDAKGEWHLILRAGGTEELVR